MVATAPSAGLSFSLATKSNRSPPTAASGCRETGFLGQRQMPQNSLPHPTTHTQRLRAHHKRRQSGPKSKGSGNLRSRENEWWRSQSLSNESQRLFRWLSGKRTAKNSESAANSRQTCDICGRFQKFTSISVHLGSGKNCNLSRDGNSILAPPIRQIARSTQLQPSDCFVDDWESWVFFLRRRLTIRARLHTFLDDIAERGIALKAARPE